ncbi:MAG: M1 family metallopeptidase [Bacteroidetes bacterium]|nr:M1 family metallopeptidase [Bacteroidota bacterium]
MYIFAGSASAQYWQQEVNYRIDVALNDTAHSLTGFEKIDYTNNSPDTLRFIWFHLWPNAYKNDKTAFTDQQLENGSTAFYFSNKEEKGYINRLDFKVNNKTVRIEDHPQHSDIIKLLLPEPLAPGKKITITTPFHVKLPFNFSRGGHDGQSYQVTQWYPKPVVYDRNGWHPMPYLDQGEFYSEFGQFDISITLPENYVVAATGELQNATEKDWLKSRAGYSWEPIKQKEKNATGQYKTTYQQFPASASATKTLRYIQNNIHDFAWFADKRFIVNYDTCRLSSGKIIDVMTFYTPAEKKLWEKSNGFSKDAVRHYSDLVGEYPYSIVQAVQGPESFGGGMEYPTITVISPTDDSESLDYVIAHEIGHNWFYGILGTNERKYPWMDEGINSYYEKKYKQLKNPKKADHLEQALLETAIVEKKDQPISTASADFSLMNYALIAYFKTGEWLSWLENLMGTATFNKAMQAYFRKWQFKHPQPEDLKVVLESESERNLDAAFALLDKKGPLPLTAKKGIALQGPAAIVSNKNFAKNTAITVSPIIGANSYDKLMAGLLITNLRLPPNRFQFLFTPMYATGSKEITGIGFMNVSLYPDRFIRKIDIGISGSRFTVDEFKPDSGSKASLQFHKLVPGIRLTLRQKNPRSTILRYVQFKSFLIQEEGLRFFRDSVITPTDTTLVTRFQINSTNRTLNQLRFVLENNRTLYPYRGELNIDQGDDFVRAAFTGNYFFNYPKSGGLTVRLFAGKFFYTGGKTIPKQFATDRYHLNMTGANGYEDYTYSDYFIGRNRFQGLSSQQIMERDGAFKVRTDLLADKVGKTDDWLAAANFSTTIPASINPLSLLPVKIPLKIFFDIGTYADAWKPNADGDRFLFDMGLHIPLLKETVNIYIPLIYSKVYKNYFQSTIEKQGRIWKTISFSIDISHFRLRKFTGNQDF